MNTPYLGAGPAVSRTALRQKRQAAIEDARTAQEGSYEFTIEATEPSS